jgi:hypothetical protein
MAYGQSWQSRSRKSRLPDKRLIALHVYFEHISCAVKLLAYTLDISLDLASAVQQISLFPWGR